MSSFALLLRAEVRGCAEVAAVGDAAERDADRERHRVGGRLVGGVYAANTLGAILGAVTFSMIIMPARGSQDSQRILIAVACVAGVRWTELTRPAGWPGCAPRWA